MNAASQKYIKAILNLLLALVGLVLLIWLLPRAIVFFMPFIIAWIIAWIAHKPVHFLEKKLKIKRKAGSVFVIIVVIGLVILIGYFLASKLIQELFNFIRDIPVMWAAMEADFAEVGNSLSRIFKLFPENIQSAVNSFGEEASQWVGDLIGKISAPTIVAVGNFAKQLPTVIIGIIMCLLASYFFVAERETVTEGVKKLLPGTWLYRLRIIKSSMVKAVGGYFKAQFKIEFWIFLILMAGFFVLRVDYAPLIALGVGFLDFLPFFGTGTVMVPWAIVKFFSADYRMTIGLLILWGVSQLARQVIQPKIVGDSVGVPPIPTLFLLYIGYMAGGVIGMIVAVPVGLIFWTMYREGLFETTKNSVGILLAGFNHFRRLTPEDMEIIDSSRREREEEIVSMEKAAREKEREAALALERAKEEKRQKKAGRRQKVQK